MNKTIFIVGISGFILLTLIACGLRTPVNTRSDLVGNVQDAGDADVTPDANNEGGSFWPPPEPSSKQNISQHILTDTGNLSLPTFENINKILCRSLDWGGYTERVYYKVPDGFALITRIEQFEKNGQSKPGDERWLKTIGPPHKVSLHSFLSSLFIPRVGYFRIIAFVVTPESLETEGKADKVTAQNWFSKGKMSLPDSISEKQITKHHKILAMVYEFKATKINDNPSVNYTSGNTTDWHLRNAKIMAGLGSYQ